MIDPAIPRIALRDHRNIMIIKRKFVLVLGLLEREVQTTWGPRKSRRELPVRN